VRRRGNRDARKEKGARVKGGWVGISKWGRWGVVSVGGAGCENVGLLVAVGSDRGKRG